jgi:hypothetical protein
MHTWFAGDPIYCDATVTNKKDENVYVTTKIKLLKEGDDVTYNPDMVSLSNYYFEYYSTLRSATKINAGETAERLSSFSINVPGVYDILLISEAIKSNLNDVENDEDSLQLQFKVISQEDYNQKENNDKIIFITILIAIFFSTPLALSSIKQLTEGNNR